MTEFVPDAQRRWAHFLLHPFLIGILLPSSLSPAPNYMLQWALVVGIGIPVLLLASTPPAPGFGIHYQRMAGVVAVCAATATVAGFFFGGNLGIDGIVAHVNLLGCVWGSRPDGRAGWRRRRR